MVAEFEARLFEFRHIYYVLYSGLLPPLGNVITANIFNSFTPHQSSAYLYRCIANPRCPCAARVTVLCLFVCLSVCYNSPGLSSVQNAEISTSTKCRRYAQAF